MEFRISWKNPGGNKHIYAKLASELTKLATTKLASRHSAKSRNCAKNTKNKRQ